MGVEDEESTMSRTRTNTIGTIFIAMILTGLFAHAQDTRWKQLGDGKQLDCLAAGRSGEISSSRMACSNRKAELGLLWYTPEKFGNCVIRVEHKTQRKTTIEGCSIRIPKKPTEAWIPVNRCYEVQIDDSQDDYT